MPIVQPTNNRVLNNNARAVDVAKATVAAVLDVQSRKVDAAFQVDGYDGIMYQYLEHGPKCACQSRNRALNSRLSEDGKASPGAINELLIANSGNFGVRAYGTERKSDVALRQAVQTPEFEVDLGFNRAPTSVALPSLFDESDLDVSNRKKLGNLTDRTSTAGGIDADVATNITEDREFEVRDEVSDFDSGNMFGYSDVSCPICFGSGYTGGFSLLHGYRSVLTFQDPGSVLPATATIQFEKDIPSVITHEASWNVLFPAGCVSVDALRVWNVDRLCTVSAILVDGQALAKNEDILLFCDGRPHTVKVDFGNEPVEFTHLEIQLCQSEMSINFAVPKQSKGSNMNLRERTEPFQLFLSPRIPFVKTLDVLVESTYGRALQVKTVTGQNTNKHVTLGWETDVRPVQPQELFWMLPRRNPAQMMNKKPIVRDNEATSGNFTRT